jgi:DNA polymerase-1
MAKAFLIDGTAFCYRAFYAIRALSTSDGRSTNAVYGFATMLRALRKLHRPDYLAVAFDAGKPTFRHERFEAYKIQRKPMPESLVSQLPLIKELLAAYRLCVIEREGYEAEDLLATIARRIAGQTLEVFLVTGDKDLLQLVGPQVKVYNPHKDDAIVDEQKVVERYGVPPNRLVDLLALMGDDIDNIPGVPGIGEKTASQLLRQFGSLDALYDRLDEVDSPSRRETLMEFRKQVELARELARIDREVPIEVDLNALAVREPDWTRLRRLFRQLEFKRLLAELDAAAPAGSASSVGVHVLEDPADVERLAHQLEGARQPVAIGFWSGGVLGLALNDQEAWIAPISANPPTMGIEPLAGWLASPDHPKIGHDLKQVVLGLRAVGLELAGLADDTMIAASLLNPASTNPSLQDVAEEWREMRLPPLRSLPADQPLTPMAQQVCAIGGLVETLTAKLRDAGLESLYREVELPLVRVLADMESTGVALDQDLLASMRKEMESKLALLTEELYAQAGCRFNLNSPKQLADVLFNQLKLPVVKRTKTGLSTDSEVLQKLASRHPLPQKLLEYRELAKLISTYLEALPKLIHPASGRIHASFHQTGAATGRLSSSEPNLQNIPIKTELGRQIRKAFIAPRGGWCLVSADYSQIELRILAHLCGDAQLLEAFRQETDIHRRTASLIYGVPEQEVTPEMRSAMKAINYGIIYGMSAHGLSNELGIPHEEASAFIEAYFARYPKVRAFLDEQIEHARRDGYVQTLLGRRRYIPEIASPNQAVRQFGERMAVNAPIQGTAADLIKRAMVQVAARLREGRLESRMILQVHDELVFEAPVREPNALAQLVRDVMEHAIELAVPLRVTVKAGPNWLDLAPIE